MQKSVFSADFLFQVKTFLDPCNWETLLEVQTCSGLLFLIGRVRWAGGRGEEVSSELWSWVTEFLSAVKHWNRKRLNLLELSFQPEYQEFVPLTSFRTMRDWRRSPTIIWNVWTYFNEQGIIFYDYAATFSLKGSEYGRFQSPHCLNFKGPGDPYHFESSGGAKRNDC